jgi:SAM-dependent methyltransferase
LAEDLQIWAAERGITLDVYGVDFVPELIRKAKARSGVHPDHFFVADVNTFIPGRSFDYIRSETNYFKSPSHLQRYIDYLEPGGKLIITKYDDDTGSEFDEFEEKIRKLNWGPVSVYRNAQTCLVVIEKQTSHVAK